MTEQATDKIIKWSIAQKLIFLFVGSYMFFCRVSISFDILPYLKDVVQYYNKFIDFITKLIGNYLLGIYPLNRIEGTDSGDTLFDYVKLVTNLLLAFVTTSITFTITRKKENYIKSYALIMIYGRYVLGFYMIGYGLGKIFVQQFPFPELYSLEERYGSSSPEHLLWTFMGFSRAYSAFTGWMEFVAGILLLFRKTTVLGCFLTIAIMVNVVMLNFCYDVPVKIHSSHLLLITLLILIPNYKRLFTILVLNKRDEVITPAIIPRKPWVWALKAVFVLVLITYMFYEKHTTLIIAPKPMQILNGTYKTNLFVINKDTLPPLTTDTVRWDKIIIEGDVIYFFAMKKYLQVYVYDIDTLNKTLIKRPDNDTVSNFNFTYKNLPDDGFSILGKLKKDTIFATFKRKQAKDYPLVNRGFHWINDYDYNN